MREQLRNGAGVPPSSQVKTRIAGDARKSDGAALGGAEAANAASSTDEAMTQERRAKEAQRDWMLSRVLSAPQNAKLSRILGVPLEVTRPELMQAVRLALRLLHPDRSMNVPLRNSTKGRQLETAFKRINALKDTL